MGQGGAGRGRFSLARRLPYNGLEGLFCGGSPLRPHPGPAPAHCMDGSPFLSTCFNGESSGDQPGPGAVAVNPKNHRRPVPFCGAGWGIAPGARGFRCPGVPATNTTVAISLF